MNQSKLQELARGLRKAQRNPYTRENRVLLLTMQYPEEQPREIGERYEHRYHQESGTEMNGDRVIKMYRRNNLGKVQERIALCQAVWETTQNAVRTLKAGGQVDWAALTEQLPEHRQRERLLLVAVLEQMDGSIDRELKKVLWELGEHSAHDLFEAVSMEIHAADQNGMEQSLRQQLEHARSELRHLRGQMREQVEEAVAEEREQFFMLLNQEEYGQILDLLAVAQDGFAKMREQKKPVPMEIRGVQTLVRCMRRFVEDYGVTPMSEPGEILELSPREMDCYLYEGAPFHGDDQRKRVQVVSPGWEMVDKQVVISYPRVRELEE